MNTYKIVARKDFESQRIKESYDVVLKQHNWIETVEPELVIVIGGDGTMLEAFNQYYNEDVRFVCLHTGTLGFYADWKREEADVLLEKIISGESEDIVTYPLVGIDLNFNDGRKESFIGLNELIVKNSSLATFVLEVYINKQFFETFRGDGMIISTPSGSTAYNHSVGGSILHPSLEAIQVSELAAINNREFRTLNRSFVLPKHHQLELYPRNKDSAILLGVDGFEQKHSDIRNIQLQVSDKKVKFMRYKQAPFWTRVRDKFIID